MPADEPVEAVQAVPPTAPPTSPPTAAPGQLPGAQPSPYSGTPAAGPLGGPTGQTGPSGFEANRTPLMVALAVVAILAVVAVGIALTGGGGDGDDPGDDPTTTEADETTTTEPEGPPDPAEHVAYHAGYVDEAQDLGSGVVLQEYGFSTVPDSLDQNGYLPTFGMVLENTSNQIVSEFDFEWIIYDEEGSLLVNGQLEAETLQPGEILGIGYLYLTAVSRHAAEMEIRPAGPSTDWGAGSGQVSVSDVQVSTDPSNGWLTTDFSVDSSYDYRLELPRSHLILRNSDGEIVAGDHTRTDAIPRGASEGQMETLGDVSGLDAVLEEAEVYIDAGYEHP